MCRLNFAAIVSMQFAIVLTLNLPTSFANAKEEKQLSLDAVVTMVKLNDFRLKAFKAESNAFLSESNAASYLPDPTVFAAVQSIPTDTFKTDQEPMTKLKVGVRQMFPKGDSLDIKSRVAGLQADIRRRAQQAYWLTTKKSVEQAWLEAWFWNEKLTLLDTDRVHLKQILDFIRGLYEVGAKEQAELIGAKLALLKLQDTYIDAKQQYERYRQQLNTFANTVLQGEISGQSLPSLDERHLVSNPTNAQRDFALHPAVSILNQEVMLSRLNENLVEQDFKPAWGLELSYGLRDGNNSDGSARPDFLSAGINVQLPLFSNHKQSSNQAAAGQRTRAVELKRDQALSALRFEYQNQKSQYQYTRDQLSLYESQILPMVSKQKESALQAYESGEGDVQSVMDIFLKQQQAKTMFQRLRVNEQKLLSSLNALLAHDLQTFDDGDQI